VCSALGHGDPKLATTTERDLAVVDYLERALALDAKELGRQMFEATPTSRR